MTLDLTTLFIVVAVFASAVAGILLLVSWLQNRAARALACWSAACTIGAAGVALIAASGNIADVWSIAIANAILASATASCGAGCATSSAVRYRCR
jgi:hypothetical protein